MAKASIILHDSPSRKNKDGTYPVALRITHDRKRKYVSVGMYCKKDQWNESKSQFRRSYPNHIKANDALESLHSKAGDIIREFKRDGVNFSFSKFEAKFLDKERSSLIKDYFQDHIDTLVAEKKHSTASPFKTTKNALLEFGKEKRKSQMREYKLSIIDYTFLIDFESWLRIRGCKDTSISVYMRSLRTILNKAIKERLIKKDDYPFLDYQIGKRLNTKTQKRSIPIEKIKEIEALEFEPHSKLQFARDIFLFGFYTRGMNFVDMANLKKQDVSNGRLRYVRSKTKGIFDIKLLPVAQEIVDFYLQHNPLQGDFLFPVFDPSFHKTERQRFDRRKTALRSINRSLKEIAKMIGLEHLKLTTYVGRHSYANHLNQSGESPAKISRALGHQNLEVTKIYLRELDNSDLDEMDEALL